MRKLAIIGSALSGGAAQIIDAVRTCREYEVVAIFDKDVRAIGTSILDVPVLASSTEVERYWKSGLFEEAVIGLGGNLKERERIFNTLNSIGVLFANVIDRTVQIRSNVKMGRGNVLLANTFIGPFVTIGDNCYVITNTCINHDSIIGSHTYFSAGCVIAGNVQVGSRVRFDTASGAKAKVFVADDTVVSAGVVLIA